MEKKLDKLYKEQWDQSYIRNENNILYPNSEVVKFLNRYVRKKVDNNAFIDILNFNEKFKGLDFGCGVARSAILMEEFGIEAYGVDISSAAIKKGKELAYDYGYASLQSRLTTIDSNKLKYDDNFFDICIAESCIDSMSFENASLLINEIARVTKKYIYFSVISSEGNGMKASDKLVEDDHEHGTIQSYYDENRIHKLTNDLDAKIIFLRKIIETGISDNHFHSRYFVVLEVE